MNLYRRAIHNWERRLAGRDRNRIVRPFEWGLEWLEQPVHLGANGCVRDKDAAETLREHVAAALAGSEQYFAYQRPSDFRLRDGYLKFSTPLPTPYRKNNTVYARFLPAKNSRRAVLLLPQWNADSESHVGLGRMLNWFGITALRMSLPYHDFRKPEELQRADYHMSSNIGRTIHACREAVLDARACFDWLAGQGYESLGILGSSLGSSIALLVAAHDLRVRAAVFNHISTYVGDVVWTGLSTTHVREGLETRVTRAELRRYWSVISPAPYLDRLVGRNIPSLLLWARHDLSFLPKFSRQALAHYRKRGLPHRVVAMPCGHYTMGQAPFKYIDGWSMSWFLHRNLPSEGVPDETPPQQVKLRRRSG